jgi:hypothetical protein
VLRFWLTYNQGGRLLGVVIVDSADLIQARLKAAVAGADQGAQFCEGHKLDHATAALLPDTAIGRMLSPDEAARLVRKIERQIPKRPPAPSVKWRAATRKQASCRN